LVSKFIPQFASREHTISQNTQYRKIAMVKTINNNNITSYINLCFSTLFLLKNIKIVNAKRNENVIGNTGSGPKPNSLVIRK
jgi:hypothetical protein